MFDEIWYELNGVKFDRNRNVGITIKNYVSTYNKSLIALNAGWNTRSDTEEGYFNFCVSLNMLWAFVRITNMWSSTLVTSWYW